MLVASSVVDRDNVLATLKYFSRKMTKLPVTPISADSVQGTGGLHRKVVCCRMDSLTFPSTIANSTSLAIDNKDIYYFSCIVRSIQQRFLSDESSASTIQNT